ncbi:MAG: calcium/sodium antiporter [Rhodospirillaceae bacterium]
MNYLELAVGLVLLLGSAEVMIRAAVALARSLGLSQLMIGMTVVAFGTSAPELLVALDAALSGAPGVALGNVVGSNIANVLLIAAAAALIYPIAREAGRAAWNGWSLIVCSAIFVAVCLTGELGRPAGLGLLAVFAVYMWMAHRRDRAGNNGNVADDRAAGDEDGPVDTAAPAKIKAAVVSVLGLAGVAWGADLTVQGAVGIATDFGLSAEIIGLTVIAIGTSLPELAASAAAARRGHPDVALGNILGSNIFNMLLIGGITAVVAPLPVSQSMRVFDLWVMLAAAVAVAPVLMGRAGVGRLTAALFLLSYAGFMAALAWNVLGRLAG